MRGAADKVRMRKKATGIYAGIYADKVRRDGRGGLPLYFRGRRGRMYLSGIALVDHDGFEEAFAADESTIFVVAISAKTHDGCNNQAAFVTPWNTSPRKIFRDNAIYVIRVRVRAKSVDGVSNGTIRLLTGWVLTPDVSGGFVGAGLSRDEFHGVLGDGTGESPPGDGWGRGGVAGAGGLLVAPIRRWFLRKIPIPLQPFPESDVDQLGQVATAIINRSLGNVMEPLADVYHPARLVIIDGLYGARLSPLPAFVRLFRTHDTHNTFSVVHWIARTQPRKDIRFTTGEI